VLPSRSRLQSGNPESLLPASSTIRDAGASIYNAVRNLDDGIDRMPESREWAGQARDEASKMFGRATERSSAFKNYTEAFASAVKTGSASIAEARPELLAKADEIDSGPLNAPTSGSC
jgi:uncharacterized protein YukE